MASKRFQNKPCVYCEHGRSESTGDHVFAREFVLLEHRANLPKVPCCRSCNTEKSKLEHYLTAVLPFGGRHSGAAENLLRVENRLAKNHRLHRELAEGWNVNSFSSEVVSAKQTSNIPFDGKKLCELAKYMAKGMLFHQWEIRLTPEYVSMAKCVTEEGDMVLEKQIFERFSGEYHEGDLGCGALRYRVTKSKKEPWLLFWRMTFYDALISSDEGDVLSSIWVIQCRREVESVCRKIFD